MNCPECGHSVFAHGPNGCYYDPNCACETTRKDISEHIETQLAALSWARWIPVAERLPEDRQDVLVLTDDNDCSTGRWNEAVKRWDIKYSNQQFFRTYFVYWMPLPPAPETEGTK